MTGDSDRSGARPSRLEASLHLAARARREGVACELVLAPDPAGARQRLGVSDADARFPYALGRRWGDLVEAALGQVAALYVVRNREELGEESYDRLLLAYEAALPSLPRVTFEVPSMVRTPALRGAMARAPRLMPGLDAGVLMAWWGVRGAGRPLLEAWGKAMGRAAREMAATGGSEDTVVLVQWLVRVTFALVPQVVDRLGLPPEVHDEVRAALAIALHLTHEVVFHLVWGEVGPELAARPDTTWRWRLLIAPELALQAASARDPGVRAVPFFDAPASLVPDVLDRVAGLGRDEAVRVVTREVTRQRGVRAEATALGVEATLLAACHRVLVAGAGDPRGAEVFRSVRELRRRPALLRRILQDRRARREWLRRLRVQAEPLGGGDARDAVEGLARGLERARPDKIPRGTDEPTFWARLGEAVLESAGGLAAARSARHAALRLSRFDASVTDRDLATAHAEGRVYLLDVSDRPILSGQSASAQVGHLFTDMKDFTRRTAELKEAVTADFLRTAFYGPILSIARDYFRGLTHLSDRGGVYLNALLGDAVSMSGDILALVEIARRIRAHLRDYALEIERRFGDLDDTLRARLALAAGTFIGYGAPPEVIVFEDEIWGEMRVSIAEKINESARGCARNASVLEIVEAEVEYMRRHRGVPGLARPFSVYVRPVGGLPVEAPLALALTRARAHGDEVRIREVCRRAAEHAATAITRAGPGSAGEGMLYNVGEAMSGEALAAYGRALGAGARAWRLEVSVESPEGGSPILGPDLLRRFAFVDPVLCLVRVEAPGRDPLVVRWAGRVRFKGLADPTEVWEVVDLTTPVGEALGQASFWASAQEADLSEVASWPSPGPEDLG